jgi:glycosyltransferase involved in cell wall biosynthesis
MTVHPHVSVVLPVYLNRPHLPELHRRLSEVLRSFGDRYELVFVDDAGGDGSREWLEECRRRDDRTVVVQMPHNSGQHRAVLAGLARTAGDVVVVMDADLQDPPEVIPRLLEELGTNDGVVFARRAERHQSVGRHWTGRIFKRLLRRVAGSRVPVGTGMFFVAARRVIDAALPLSANARYVPLLLDLTGAPMSAIEVTKELRPDSPSAYSSWRRLQLALGAIRQAIEQRKSRTRT